MFPAYTLISIIIHRSVASGVINGIIFGIVLGIVMSVYISNMSASSERKVQPLRNEILKRRRIICEGPANHKQKTVIGGWLFLSEDALEFYQHTRNGVEGANIAILLDDITNVETRKNLLIIHSVQGVNQFVVYYPNEWKTTILRIL